jgi:hypothetical protein
VKCIRQLCGFKERDPPPQFGGKRSEVCGSSSILGGAPFHGLESGFYLDSAGMPLYRKQHRQVEIISRHRHGVKLSFGEFGV